MKSQPSGQVVEQITHDFLLRLIAGAIHLNLNKKQLMPIVMVLHHFLLTESRFPDFLLRFEVIGGIRKQFIKNMTAFKLRIAGSEMPGEPIQNFNKHLVPVSYTHLRAHETDSYLV